MLPPMMSTEIDDDSEIIWQLKENSMQVKIKAKSSNPYSSSQELECNKSSRRICSK